MLSCASQLKIAYVQIEKQKIRSYKESLKEYKKANRLDEKDWISNKVVILFLESDKDHKVTY